MIKDSYPIGEEFPIIDVNTKLGELRFSLYGGQVLSWTPAGEKPVIFWGKKAIFQRGKALRGGVPICWPWFGKGVDGKQSPSHGIARISTWKVNEKKEHESGRATLIFSLDPDDQKLPQATYMVGMGKNELRLMLATSHREDGEDIPLSCALHTYFAVSHHEKVAVTGLEELPYREYAEDAVPHPEDPLVPLGHIDRTYCPVPEDREVCLHDPGWGRTLEIERIRAHSHVVWHPGIKGAEQMADLGGEEATGMLALEVALLPEENYVLHAGETHIMGMVIRLVHVKA